MEIISQHLFSINPTSHGLSDYVAVMGGGDLTSLTEFWFKRPALITRLQAGTEVATIYSNFLNQAT